MPSSTSVSGTNGIYNTVTKSIPPIKYNGGKEWSNQDLQVLKSFESGKTKDWSGCTPYLIAAKNEFEAECNKTLQNEFSGFVNYCSGHDNHLHIDVK